MLSVRLVTGYVQSPWQCLPLTLRGFAVSADSRETFWRGPQAAALLEELPRLVARAPLETVALPNLGLGRHPFVDEQVARAFAALADRSVGGKVLRVNLRDHGIPPSALKLTCGICGATVYSAVDSYVLLPPQQRHISVEVFTPLPPDEGATVPAAERGSLPESNTRQVCRNRCHDDRGLWLVDHESGHIVAPLPYGAACGGPTHRAPALVRAEAARHDPDLRFLGKIAVFDDDADSGRGRFSRFVAALHQGVARR
jgi:hypothetical protein